MLRTEKLYLAVTNDSYTGAVMRNDIYVRVDVTKNIWTYVVAMYENVAQ